MKCLGAAILLLLPAAVLADGGHPERFGPMPPDPVMVKRAPSAVTPALLAIQRMSLPGELYLWELLKSTVPLTTPQVRTVTLDLLRVSRFYDDEQPANVVYLAAWFDRDPETATREVLNIPDWEDRDDNIGSYDSDVEYFGKRLWGELARTDFPAARRIAAGLKGIETRGQFFGGIEHGLTPSPQQAAALVELAVKQLPAAGGAEEVAGHLAVDLHGRIGAEATAKWARGLPQAAGRESILKLLAECKEPQPKEGDPFAFTPPDDPELAKLKSLEISPQRACRIPFAVLREVLQRTPEQSLILLHKLKDNQRRDGWLGWMLLMRAMEGDARAAGEIEVPMVTAGWLQMHGAIPLWPVLPATAPDAMQTLRDTPADQQDAALASALTRAPLDQWENWAALASELAAPPSALRPLLMRMAASGRGPQAVKLAATLHISKDKPDAGIASLEAIIAAWALHDFRAAAEYAATQKPGLDRTAACAGLKHALHRLPAQTALEQWPDDLSESEVEENDHYWVYLAFENREAGFRFFASRGENSAHTAVTFANTAARFDPVRAVQLVTRFSADKYGLQNLLCRIVCHWPHRFHEFLAPVSSEETWQAVAATVARAHPDKTAAILKGVPFTSVWDAAGRELAFTRPDLMKAIAPHMSEAVRYRLMVERRRN